MMPAFDTFFQNCLSDTEKKVMELLMENFRQQAFFGEPWPAAKNPGKGGKKLLYQSNDLQGGFHSRTEDRGIVITNSVAYAAIHNDGGEITVTAAMKKYFWAMYYKAAGAMSKTKSGKPGNNQRNRALNAEAEYWKSLAMMKTGSRITIPRRRFLGDHPQLDESIQKVVDRNMEEAIKEMMSDK